jgi:hypothetical protein
MSKTRKKCYSVIRRICSNFSCRLTFEAIRIARKYVKQHSKESIPTKLTTHELNCYRTITILTEEKLAHTSVFVAFK